MTQVLINLYSFSELSKEGQMKAINDRRDFMETFSEWENENESFADEYVQESIEMNEYIFFQDGTLAHCTTYTDKHPKTGTTEFHFHGHTYDITQNVQA